MNKKLFTRLIHSIGISDYLRKSKKHTVTILNLHRISPEENYFWNPMKPSTFESLLQYLLKHYTIIQFRELNDIGRIEKPIAILSFDDGYKDFYEYALPLLVKYNVPSNHNIVNECANHNKIIWTQRLNCIFDKAMLKNIPVSFRIDDIEYKKSSFKTWMHFYLAVYKKMLTIPLLARELILTEKEKAFETECNVQMMNWYEIKECAANKVEIGSHTYSHDVISTITDTVILEKEIEGSVREIDEKLNQKTEVIAWPNGQSSEAAERVARASGIIYSAHVEDKINYIENLQSQQIFYRINLVEESLPSMILRTELFYSKIKNYV